MLYGVLNSVDLPHAEKRRLLQVEGLDYQDLRGVSATIAFRSYLRIFDALARAANEPLLGLEISSGTGPELVGASGYIFLASADLESGLRSFAESVFSIQDVTCFSLENGANPIASYRITDEAMQPRRQDVEFSLGYIHTLIRTCLGPGYAPKEVYFEHACPARRSRYDAFFGCPVYFEQETNALVLRKEDIRKRSSRFDPNLIALLQHYTQLLGSREYVVTTLTETVNQVLSGIVERPEIGIRQVAARLGLSESTLRRRLQREKTSFREIVRRKRIAVAKRLLSETGMNVLQVAQKVGYAETASFTRAFVAEAGQTPSEFRNNPGTRSSW